MGHFKGFKIYYAIAEMLLLMQLFKIANFAHSMEGAAIGAVVLTIACTGRFAVRDKLFTTPIHWILVALMLVMQIVIGLDRILDPVYYNLLISFCGALGVLSLFILDTPSIRKRMDENAYILKGAYALVIMNVSFVLIDFVLRTMLVCE